MEKLELITTSDIAFERLMELTKDIPQERLEEPVAEGQWSFKEMAIHFSFWNTVMIHALDDLFAGREFDWEPYWNMDEQNKQAVERRRNDPLKRVLNEFRVTHSALMEALRRTDDEKLERSEMTRKMTFLVPDHYLHHRVVVEAWAHRLPSAN